MQMKRFSRLAVGLLGAALGTVWALRTQPQIHAPMVGPAEVGYPLELIGIALITLGLLRIPAAYRVFPHPIATGTVLSSFALSIATGSSSGFWLVSPAIGIAAIVFSLGRPRSIEADRFLPPDIDGFPGVFRRFRFLWNVLLPWFGLYELCASLGVAPGSVDLSFSVERGWPIVTWSEFIYFSTYIGVIAAPFLVPTSRALRRLTIQAWVAMILVFPIYLTFPTLTPRRPLLLDSWLSPLLAWERSMDPPSLAFPSFHTTWAFLIAAAMPPGHRVWWRSWAVAVGLSCVTTGMHSVLDVLAGWLLAESLLRYEIIWPRIVHFCDYLLRIPSRAGWTALGVFAGVLTAGSAAAPGTDSLLAAGILGACIGDAIVRLGVGNPSTRRYMFGCNLFTGLILLRLGMLNAPITLVAGAAVMLRAAADFLIFPGRQTYAVMLGFAGAALTCAGSSAPLHNSLTPLVFAAAAALAIASGGFVALSEIPSPVSSRR